jgi:hypothetical protein
MDTNFTSPSPSPSTPHRRQKFDLSKIKKNLYIPVAVIIFLVIVLGLLSLRKHSAASGGNGGAASADQVSVQKARATQTLNKTFKFPLKDDTGKEVSTISYTIQNIELRDQIIVKGETATAVKGRTFAIFNLKLTNNYTKAVQINARDYVRLIVDGSSEKLAADIHNDPVEVQAISTKYTRIGFPIDSDQRKFILQVGEISGAKQDIKISL